MEREKKIVIAGENKEFCEPCEAAFKELGYQTIFCPRDGLQVIKAIREKCLECSGSRNEVKECNVTGCALYAFRLGKNPYRTKRELSEEQREWLDRLTEQGYYAAVRRGWEEAKNAMERYLRQD